jgi:osomolarity two-component system sensor histidine kinase TcsA
MFDLPEWPTLVLLLGSAMGLPIFRHVAFDRPNIAAPSHAKLVRLYLRYFRLVGIVDFTAHNMMTSDEVQPTSTQPGRGARSIDEAFEAFTPVPSVLLDSALCIIRVSASYLAFNHLTSHECVGFNIYDLATAKTLSPGPAALQVVLDNAIATKNVYATGEHAAPGIFSTTIRAVPIFEQDTLLYVLLEVLGTTVEHERREAINDQLDTNDTYRVVS